MKPLSFADVLHGAISRTIWRNLNRENEASLAEAIFNNAEVYKYLSYLKNWTGKTMLPPTTILGQAQTAGFISEL